MAEHPEIRPSRRERPAKPALSRAGIIATAVQLLHAEGLERVTMRRLAQELDTGAASLYVYVRNTAELHAAVLDELLGAVDLSPATVTVTVTAAVTTSASAANAAGATAKTGARSGPGTRLEPEVGTPASVPADWQDRLIRVLSSYTTVLFEHPGLAQSALVTRPSGAHYLNLLEAVLSLLAEGGVPADRAAWAVDLLLHFATSTAAEQSARARAADVRAEEDALATALLNADTAAHPHIAELGAELLSGPGPARLTWGFHVLINGITYTPRPRSGPADVLEA